MKLKFKLRIALLMVMFCTLLYEHMRANKNIKIITEYRSRLDTASELKPITMSDFTKFSAEIFDGVEHSQTFIYYQFILLVLIILTEFGWPNKSNR